MAPIKMNRAIVIYATIIFIFAQIIGCKSIKSSDEIAKTKLSKATQLLISRDKIAMRSTNISHIKEGIVITSTADVDNFVKKRIDVWMNIANDLENFSSNFPSNKFSKDAIFTSTLLWIGISQADRQYSKKVITICEKALSVDYKSNLNYETIKMLSKAPSIKYLIGNEFSKGDGIKAFLRRILISEYIKMEDVAGAENWLKRSNISEEEKQRLNKYINSYKMLKKKLIGNGGSP